MGMEIGYQILVHLGLEAKVWQQICFMCIEREKMTLEGVMAIVI
jgi:hypothetical protein